MPVGFSTSISPLSDMVCGCRCGREKEGWASKFVVAVARDNPGVRVRSISTFAWTANRALAGLGGSVHAGARSSRLLNTTRRKWSIALTNQRIVYRIDFVFKKDGGHKHKYPFISTATSAQNTKQS